MTAQTKTTVNWDALRQVPPGKEGEVRTRCETCEWPIYSAGGLKIPSLKGYYCRAICMEQALCGTHKSDVPLGQRLLNHIRLRHPELYRALIGSEYGKQAKMAFAESTVTEQVEGEKEDGNTTNTGERQLRHARHDSVCRV